MPGVSILFSNAKATESDVNGVFRLVFSDKKPGDLIFKEKIQKNGYEVVNAKELEVNKISNTDQLGIDIILAPLGMIEAAKREYYKISEDALLAGFEKQKKILREALQKAQLSQDAFTQKYQALMEQYEQKSKNLDALSEKFAKINFDDVSELYREAFKLFKEGNIDESVKKLESVNLIERTEKRLRERTRINRADSILKAEKKLNEEGLLKDMEVLELQAEMYALQSNIPKAEAIYDQLLKLDSTNLNNLLKIAFFYQVNNLYQKSLNLYLKVIKHPEINDWQTANGHRAIGELYTLFGNLPKALEHFSNLLYFCVISSNGF